MQTRQKIIDKVPYEIREPYGEGHVCTASEARALNQIRSENIGKNLRSKIAELHAEGKREEALALVAQADAEFSFNHITVASQSQKLEPIEREARKVAIELIKRKLAERGQKIEDAPQDHSPDTWASYIESRVNEISVLPEVLAVAEERVTKRQELTRGVAA